MSLLDRIKLLAATHQMTMAELERKLDFSNGSLRKWGSSMPSGDKIEKVADYFNVSTDYLLGNTDNPVRPYAEMSPDEMNRPVQEIVIGKN